MAFRGNAPLDSHELTVNHCTNWLKSLFHYGFDGLTYFVFFQILFQPPKKSWGYLPPLPTTWVDVRFESAVFNDVSYLDFVELGR